MPFSFLPAAPAIVLGPHYMIYPRLSGDAVPLLRIELGGQLRRSFDVGEEIVTCFLSPSRTLRDVRIFSATCFGV
jgi:hypothetical protein